MKQYPDKQEQIQHQFLNPLVMIKKKSNPQQLSTRPRSLFSADSILKPNNISDNQKNIKKNKRLCDQTNKNNKTIVLKSMHSLTLNQQNKIIPVKRICSAYQKIGSPEKQEPLIKLRLRTQRQKTPVLSISQSIPNSIRHSRRYTQKYKYSLQKSQIRKASLKLLPRKKRKKIVYKVTPDLPDAFESPVFIYTGLSAKKVNLIENKLREKNNIILNQRKGQIQSTINDLLKGKKPLKVGILTGR